MAGRLATRGWLRGDGLERLAVSTAVGLSLLAHLGFLLGSLGLLAAWPVAAALAALHLFGLPVWREAAREVREGWARGWLRRGALLLLAAAPLFYLALYPPTAFDETLYHLPFARAFARTGALPFLPELRNPVFPQLQEVLLAGVLLLAGDVSTHLVQLLATFAAAALLAAWGRRLISPGAGGIAAAAYLGSPIVVHLAGTGYVEPLLALFVAASVYGFQRWREEGRGIWLALAAAFAASAAGVKYLGLFFVGAVLAAALPPAWRQRRVLHLVAAAAVALAVLAPWYGRILAHTGSPLFPFYPEIFGSTPWDPDFLPARTLPERLADFATFPWDMLFARRSVGWQPPWSPVYLLAAPLLVLGLLREPRVRVPLGMALAYSLVFLLLPPDARYLAVVLPLLSLALGGVLVRWIPRLGTARVAAAVLVLLFLPGWLYAFYRIDRQGALPATPGERHRYLARELPAYRALQHLNRLHGRDYTVYGIHTENMVYYAEGTLLGDWNGPARYSRVLPHLADAESFHRTLRGLGVEYLLLVAERGYRLPDTPEWRRRFRRVYADGGAELFELSPFAARGGT